MRRRPTRCIRTDTHFPYTTPFRAAAGLDRARQFDGVAGAFDIRHALAFGIGGEIVNRGEVEKMLHLARKAAHLRCAQAEPGLGQVTNDGMDAARVPTHARSEEHTSELQSLMRTSYAVF